MVIERIGDFDGDGIPEIVVSGTTAWYVLKATGNDQYERIFYYQPQTPQGWIIQLDIDIYDLDHNGLKEIITSWKWVDNGGWLHARTEIFEKGIDMEWIYPSQHDTLLVDSTVTLRWHVYDTISVDSLSIFLTSPSGQNRTLIFTGNPLTDTSYNWVVPDTSGFLRFLLLVTGYGRRDSLSSPVVRIAYTGVEESQAPSYPYIDTLYP